MKVVADLDNKIINGCKVVEVELDDCGHKVWQKGLWIPYNELQLEVELTKEQMKRFGLLFNKEAKTYLKAKLLILESLLETYNNNNM